MKEQSLLVSKRIFISADHGMAIIYFLQSDVVPTLLAAGVNHALYEKCMGCGICISKCDQNALSLVRDEAKGAPLEICSVMNEAIFAG